MAADAIAVSEPRRRRRPLAIIAVLAVLAVLVYVLGFLGYGMVVAADEYLSGQPRDTNCQTPGTKFGWAYEAVNYDQADDAALVSVNPDLGHCISQGRTAGTAIVAPDGVHLAAWYVEREGGAGHGPLAGSTGPTIVLVHGGKTNKSGMLEYAAPLHEHYNLLIVDLRNSGRSSDARSTGGVLEQHDLEAFIDWLDATKQPSWIAVLGNSNGAATALAEARTDPRVRALVLDSMHASLESQLGNVITSERHLPAWPGAWGIMLGVQLRLGESVRSVDPVVTIQQIGARPVLLTHGELDHIDRPADSLDRNVAAARSGDIEIEVHRCAGADHGQVVSVCATEWATWVLEFLAAHGGAGTAQR